jgi:ABC-type amino acid transport substrate-binding protein
MNANELSVETVQTVEEAMLALLEGRCDVVVKPHEGSLSAWAP